MDGPKWTNLPTANAALIIASLAAESSLLMWCLKACVTMNEMDQKLSKGLVSHFLHQPTAGIEDYWSDNTDVQAERERLKITSSKKTLEG